MVEKEEKKEVVEAVAEEAKKVVEAVAEKAEVVAEDAKKSVEVEGTETGMSELLAEEAVTIKKEAPDVESNEGSEEVEVQGGWAPKTEVGKLVKSGKITNIDTVLDAGKKILEIEVIDLLLPNAQSELLLIGQSKGKFGGGQRRVFRQTQKKTREGNKPSFSTVAVVGNNNGYVGLGYGKAKETVPAREKAFRNAKLNIFKIRRGAGSWEDASTEPHSIPFAVEGRCGSVRLKLMPAPKGTGLCIEKECAKILKLAGIKDVWSKTIGQTKTKMNTIAACERALRKLMKVKVDPDTVQALHVLEGCDDAYVAPEVDPEEEAKAKRGRFKGKRRR
jgi:small subunit ribosomal protein S5